MIPCKASIVKIPVLCLAGIFISIAVGEKCVDGRPEYLNLPRVIGAPDIDSSVTYVLRCDTVHVPKGSKTVVYAGSFLHFAKKNSGNSIQVEGTLILLGMKDRYVTLAGARDLRKTTVEPAKAPWSGITVLPGGSLEMSYTGMFGAANPVIVNSPDVKIVNSYFTGGKGIVRQDGSWYLLDSQFTAVNNLDFSKPTDQAASDPASLPSRLSREETQELLARDRKSFWGRPVTWFTLGGSAAAVSGYFIYLWLQPVKPVEVTPPMDPIPPAF